VFDETHHIANSGEAFRPVYAKAGRIRELFPDAVCLAVSATVSTQAANTIRAELGLSAMICDAARRENLILIDKRGITDRDSYLAEILKDGSKTIIYVNSRATSIALCKTLRKAHNEFAHKIVYYHAGMLADDRRAVEHALRDGKACCVVATSAFGEGINIPDVRDVVLYHLPFSALDFNQMSGRAGRDGNEARVHIIFGNEDNQINLGILYDEAPPRKLLASLWRGWQLLLTNPNCCLPKNRTIEASGLQQVNKNNGIPYNLLDDGMPNEETCTCYINAARETDPEFFMSATAIARGVSIFNDVSLLDIVNDSYGSRIYLTASNKHTDLRLSVRYSEGLDVLSEFESFCQWVLESNESELQDMIRGPILPKE
jgi:single-stranded-DNA-specific exonuclease